MAFRFLEKNPATFIAGCPCHLAHIAASHANESFSNFVNLSVEDVCVDCYYWFDKSTKRKGKLTEYFEFCNQEYQSVLKHLSVRYMERILKKLPSLKAYFQSEDFQDERFQRLNRWFTNPLLEPSLLFNTVAITIFTSFNRLLQRARSIFLGGTTKFTLNRFRNNGTISENEYLKVYQGAFHYFKDALKYIFQKFPISNEVICNSIWIDVEKKASGKMGESRVFLREVCQCFIRGHNQS